MSNSIQIPIGQRSDGWFPNPRDISSTPGGSMYATTPGGTRIRWTREQMIHLSNSPLAKSPLTLPNVPGVTSNEVITPEVTSPITVKVLCSAKANKEESAGSDEEDMFPMDPQ
eukprot:TRINITY_DN237_c0_g2_i1.p1 TRINITY_DN237_c0_g2~~TRINITY_DN237_c0_g2_i1.p1  ORF type:complete len:113 (-),score=16.05 TRINITY_DN237_c0_g2_i1:349-687(-)